MSKHTQRLVLILAAVVLAVVCIAGILWTQYDQATYISIDGVKYLRDSTELDLSGRTLTEADRLTELTGLQKLDLRNTGISTEVYKQLKKSLPDCQILWSVPFQGGFFSCETENLRVSSLTEDDVAMLAYFPKLRTLNAVDCRDYDVLTVLDQAERSYKLFYSIEVGGKPYYEHHQRELAVENPDVQELKQKLPYFRFLETVVLKGQLPEQAEIISLMEAMPEIKFDWDFEVCGVPTNSMAEVLILDGVDIPDETAVEAMLPCFYDLRQVDMCGCGVSNEKMDALNRRHNDVKFVWTTSIGYGRPMRTDSTIYMPDKGQNSVKNIQYFQDLIVIDLGHVQMDSCEFVKDLPNLEYLIMGDSFLGDIRPLAAAKNLKFLEIFLCQASDFWPLLNCTNLKALNISYTPFGDIAPLYQMTWLDHLWLSGKNIPYPARAALHEALPNTEMCFDSDSSTDKGWRNSPYYYEMRDILGMWYMTN